MAKNLKYKMSRYIEKLEMATLPTIALNGIVAFPMLPLSLELTEQSDIDTAKKASESQEKLFLISLKGMPEPTLTEKQLYRVGTVCNIKQFLMLPDQNARLIVEGVSRAEILRFESKDGFVHCDVMTKTVSVAEGTIKSEALIYEVIAQFDEFVKFIPKASPDLIAAVKTIKEPSLFCDFVASNVLVNNADKQEILNEFDPLTRLKKLAFMMAKELKILETELDIHKKVREKLDNNQREYYLREQIKVIQSELGDVGEDSEIDEYYDRIIGAKLPREVEDKLIKELHRLEKTPYSSADATVLRNYLDTCLDIPWNRQTKDKINVKAAKKILDNDHDGLTKVKERILEFLAVKQLNPKINNQIICLAGPPGTGKTSIAASIAKAMGRKYVRVCLGGIRDEADIRGHRKTYVGAMPGRIVTAIINSKVRNPLILLDEVDKMGVDGRGDPSSALLEVLDSEQNRNFRDHFTEIPLDLSECIFIATANDISNVPGPLRDRMEIIELDSYNRYAKLNIAKHHLIRKQREAHGLTAKQIKITDDAVLELIDYYTSEAGVRNLSREIASLMRKAARKIAEEGLTGIKITSKDVAEYLGNRKNIPDRISECDEIGEVNGLAYTSVGGEMLKIEATSMKGTGKLELTGSLGDVMKESAQAALTYTRANAEKFGINPDFYKNSDIHIHVPEGAVPKDGPSAGVTITTAMVSELSKIKVHRDVAMTGEITLRGKILAIGGLKEKTMAAFKAGVKRVIIPYDNKRDIDELDPIVRENLEFFPCRTLDEALDISLVKEQ